jgi:hypothetical protein
MTNDEGVKFTADLAKDTAALYRALADCIEQGELTLTELDTIVSELTTLTAATRALTAKLKGFVVKLH